MTHTYTQLLYHLVWATKGRRMLIPDGFKDRIYGYIGGSFRGIDGLCVEVGGMPDHIHILAEIPAKHAVSDVMRDLKAGSSKWINRSIPTMQGFSWQEGFGAFAVSQSNREVVTKYIQNQQVHHKGLSFEEEFAALVRKHGIEFDPKFLWK